MADVLLQAQTVVAVLGLAALWLLESWFPYFEGRRGRGRHALRNFSLAVLNALVLSIGFAGLTATVLSVAERAGFGLLHWANGPLWLETLAGILLIDFWMYLWHRANHRLPILWRFHRVHHSDPDVDVTTAARFHVGEIVASSVLRLAVLPLVGVTLGQALLYEVLLLPVIQFHHSNVALPEGWDRRLRGLIVTPHMHRVHHSRWRPETDSNYSSIFSFWDRLAGSFRLSADPRGIRFGLDGWDTERWQSVTGLLRTPLADPSVPTEGESCATVLGTGTMEHANPN